MKHLITICLLVMSLTSTAQTVEDYTFTITELGGTPPSIKNIEKAAKKGDATSQRELGLYYVAKDKKKAYKWLLKAAEQNDAPAQYHLATLIENNPYQFGSETSTAIIGALTGRNISYNTNDSPEYIKWYEKSASNGYKLAQQKLASYYENNRMLGHSLKWRYELAQSGDVDSQIWLGEYYTKENKPNEASKWFQKAAEMGSAEGQYQIGKKYLIDNRIEDAKVWLRKATEQGHSLAQGLYTSIIEKEQREIAEREKRISDSIAISNLGKKGFLPSYSMLANFDQFRMISKGHEIYLKALCRNDVLMYNFKNNLDALDKAAYMQSEQYTADKAKFEEAKNDIFVIDLALNEYKPIFEANGVKCRFYESGQGSIQNSKTFKGSFLAISKILVPVKPCENNGYYYFQNNDIGLLQKIKESTSNRNAHLIVLCQAGLERTIEYVNNANIALDDDFYFVFPTAIYIVDKDTDDILWDLSDYIRKLDTPSAKQQLEAQIRSSRTQTESLIAKMPKKKYHKTPRKERCMLCGGTGVRDIYDGAHYKGRERCFACYGQGYTEEHYY